MRSLAGMPRAVRRPTYLANSSRLPASIEFSIKLVCANSVNSVNLVILSLLSSRSLFAPHGSENLNSHFYKWLFTKMAVSMVSHGGPGRESEQELEESHLMLKNSWNCFRISSSFVGNNPSLQIHSFSEDRGKCNKSGNLSISNFPPSWRVTS